MAIIPPDGYSPAAEGCNFDSARNWTGMLITTILFGRIKAIYIKTLPETVQSGIELVYDDLYFSDPAAIQAAGIQKRADKPTLGYTATANQNGYHTECTLDLSGAVLDYDGLAVLNRYRAESGKNCGDAVWAYGDMTEEQALAGAKYHDRG